MLAVDYTVIAIQLNQLRFHVGNEIYLRFGVAELMVKEFDAGEANADSN